MSEHVTARVVALDALGEGGGRRVRARGRPAMLGQSNLSRSRPRLRHRAGVRHRAVAASPRRPARPRGEAAVAPARRAGARRAAPRRVPTARTARRRTPRWRRPSTRSARGRRARAASSNANLRALTRLAAAVAGAHRRRGRALVPRLAGRAPHRDLGRGAGARRAGRDERARRGHAASRPAPGHGHRPRRGARRPPGPRSNPGGWCPTRSSCGASATPVGWTRCATGAPLRRTRAARPSSTLLAPEPGERIADLAAAPGGKATAIAERVGPTGAVVALDIDAGRVRMIDRRRHRIGLPHLLPLVADARAVPLRAGDLRPGAARRPVQRCRRVAPPARRPLAARARDHRRAGDAPARAARGRRAARAPRRRPRVLGVHAHQRGDARGRRVGRRRARRASPRSRHRASPGSHAVGARCCCRRLPAPTGCSCSRSAAMPDAPRLSDEAASVTAMKLAPSILSADFARARGRCRTGARGVRPPARRRDGRPLRAGPHHRSAGGEVAARAHRPVPRLPPHGRQPGRADRRVRRRRRRPLHRAHRARRSPSAVRRPARRAASASGSCSTRPPRSTRCCRTSTRSTCCW